MDVELEYTSLTVLHGGSKGQVIDVSHTSSSSRIQSSLMRASHLYSSGIICQRERPVSCFPLPSQYPWLDII